MIRVLVIRVTEDAGGYKATCGKHTSHNVTTTADTPEKAISDMGFVLYHLKEKDPAHDTMKMYGDVIDV